MEKELSNHVSEQEAINIAEKAYQNSIKLVDSEDNISVFGLGCTGAISTNRIRKGEDKAFISIRSKNHLNTCLLYTSPSPRDLSTSRMPSSA